jgi:hypothetical protein
MIGIHLGLVLPFLFAVVIGLRARAAGDAVTAYETALVSWQAQNDGQDVQGPERAAFFAAQKAPDHDKTYLRNTLWFLTGASFLAFVVILSRRPPKSERT